MTTTWVCLGVAYVIGVRVAFAYHLRIWDGGQSTTMAEAYNKWSWGSTMTLERAIAFPIMVPLSVVLYLTSKLASASFHMTDHWDRKRLEEVRLRVEVKREMEELERELSSNNDKRLSAHQP